MEQRGTVPRKVRGLRDIDPATNRWRWHIVQAATEVYRRYGFQHWDTPALEYADALGKYLPDADGVADGVYSFRNPELEPVLDAAGRELRDDANNVLMEHHHLALRYDLTAPLARLYAESLWASRTPRGEIPKTPLLRRYQFGPVYRFEAKLDPGRYREFWQLDFDSVGVLDPASDAEVCAILCDALEAIGLGRGTYEVRLNSRKLHLGLFQGLGLAGDPTLERDVLRVIDKVDKLGVDGVAAELGGGRVDPESGAPVPGLKLPATTIDRLLAFVALSGDSTEATSSREGMLARLDDLLGDTEAGRAGLEELSEIHHLLAGLGYGDDRVVLDPSVARGLAYYTGPVFEAVSRLQYRDEKGNVRRFGSISGGGRYDGLVERLLGIRVPATGASIGVDRLGELLSRIETRDAGTGPVLVVVMDRARKLEYQRIAMELRRGGIAAEVYYGVAPKMKAQLAHADAEGCPVAVIAGEDEINRGTVSIKDLRLGKRLAGQVRSRDEWRAAQPAQVEVSRADLVETVRRMLVGSSEG